LGFRRTTGERAAPPYIGRGLIEAVFDGDILANDKYRAFTGASAIDVGQPTCADAVNSSAGVW